MESSDGSKSGILQTRTLWSWLALLLKKASKDVASVFNFPITLPPERTACSENAQNASLDES